jgi:hypothetical protein
MTAGYQARARRPKRSAAFLVAAYGPGAPGSRLPCGGFAVLHEMELELWAFGDEPISVAVQDGAVVVLLR